jgi:putative transposase
MKKYNPNIHHRRSIRLKGYDYSQAGLYFITICCQNRERLFGKIIHEKMILNDAGEMIKKWYYEMENKFPDKIYHEMIIMPNHFHCIIENATTIVITKTPDHANMDTNVKQGAHVGAPLRGRPVASTDRRPNAPNVRPQHPQKYGTDNKKYNTTIGDAMDWFKTMTTNEYIVGVKTKQWPPFNGKLWQRNYWEHIIRNENEFIRISNYIRNNPINWNKDKLNGGEGNCVMEPSTSYNEENWMV